VVKTLNGDKDLGPDGFSLPSFSLVGRFLKKIPEFHAQGKFKRSLNAIFLCAFFPKKVEAMDMKDFRPISLVGGVYKIISKVQANG
jgi:hypothetical protein